MHGVKNSSWNPTLFVLPNKNSNLRMREREILRIRGLMKSHIQTYVLCLMLLSLSVPLFCSLSVFTMCLYLLSFCVSAFFVFFFLLCVLPLFIESLQRSCSLIFLSTDQIMEQFSSVFPPQFLIPCWAVTHYSAFCSFYLFHCFLNSLFLVCDIPTFPLFRSTFMKPCSLLSGVATFHLLFIFFGCFTWLVSIFCFCTRQQAMNVAHIIYIYIYIYIYIL